MAALDFRADIKHAHQTLDAIDAAVLKAAEDGRRPHLGASLIGNDCDRALWLTFRWATPKRFEARMLRLFERGHREEAALTKLLQAAGITVHTVNAATGQQFAFKAPSGHFGGSMDGACVGVPEAPKTWHVLEFKTHNAKSFKDLQAKGVKGAKPLHWAQMQVYMRWACLERALYVSVCKDDDSLHIERVDLDKAESDRLIERGERIVMAADIPDGISDKPDDHRCKWCDHKDLCFGEAAPPPNCRTCCHSSPRPGGEWQCVKFNQALDGQAQKAGCPHHVILPGMLKAWATVIDANQAENWISYQLHNGGGYFVNGDIPEAFTSAEVHAAQDKRALGWQALKDVRQQFNATLVA